MTLVMVLAHPLVLLLTVAQTLPPVDDAWVPPGPGWGYQLLVGSLIVLALLGGGAWLMRRGLLPRRAHAAVAIETAVPLGERRSLVIVAVEGRRLLLGLTPASVSLVTTLEPQAAFSQVLDQAQQRPAKGTG